MTKALAVRNDTDIMLPGDAGFEGERPVDSGIRFHIFLGLVALALLAGGAGRWATTAELDGAVIAPASFVVESNRKTVQHLEGGIVRELLVRDGDMVQANQVLLRMDSTDSDIDVDVLGSQLAELRVRRARLAAELSGASAFTFDVDGDAVVRQLDGTQQQALIGVQTDLFRAQQNARKSEKAVVAQRIVRFREEIEGLEEQRRANDRQLAIIKTELAALDKLYKRGLTVLTRVNALKREMERLQGANAGFATSQARAKNQIGELRLAVIQRERTRRETISTELASIETQISSIGPRYLGAHEKLKRVAVVAPVSGRVVDMKVYTRGGVVRPGEAILDIVPESDALVVEARVATSDIEKLRVGQDTRVRLTAFDQTDVPEANGEIVGLSADSLTDERSGARYYVARVRLADDQPHAVKGLEFVPGMPADVFVNTGKRTALSYFLKPLNDRLVKTFVQ